MGSLPLKDFFQTNTSGIHDLEIKQPLKDKIHLKFLTAFSDVAPGLSLIKELAKRSESVGLRVDTRLVDLASINFPRFFIVDNKELVFFLTTTKEMKATNIADTALWTNNKSLVSAFMSFFGELWKNSKDLLEIIEEPL